MIYEELASADWPRLLLSFVSTYHAASTLMECGNEEQKARYLPRILEGETWCQGFSEPGAGSDLARSNARPNAFPTGGDVYVVNGQKVWSTMAQYADKCLLLVRTTSDGPKQAGITFLLMDMKAKGVTVQPINQIQGDQEFCEMFLDDVEVPVSRTRRRGEPGLGRGAGDAVVRTRADPDGTVLPHARRLAPDCRADPQAWPRGGQGHAARFRPAGRPGRQRLRHCRPVPAEPHERDRAAGRCLDRQEHLFAACCANIRCSASGLAGWKSNTAQPITYGDLNTGNWMADFMNSYAWTIAGGSEEVQRNIIAERMLEMQREPKGWVSA